MESNAPSLERPISPWLEMGAYEALWSERGASFKRIADRFRAHPDSTPLDFVQHSVAEKVAEHALQILQRSQIRKFGVRVHGAGEYPVNLRLAENPVEFLYYQGWWDLVNSPCVSVVGTRNPTPRGKARAEKLTRLLVNDGYTIVSGLARGIDTIAHNTAIDNNGKTIAVIGTPLSASYPSENKELQLLIASEYLLISQIPIIRYSAQTPRGNKLFFPERNITMAALSCATIIIEAGETSGTLTQARAALQQGKKLFILQSCFTETDLQWPHRLEKLGAVRVQTYDDIKSHLSSEAH